MRGSLLLLLALAGTAAAQAPQLHPTTSPSPFAIGKQYARITMTDVYIPEDDEGATIVVALTIRNQTPLTFKFAFESEPGRKYSSTGDFLVVDHAAINSFGPIDVVAEYREPTRVSNGLSFIQGFLGTLTQVLGGPLAATLSTVSQQANAVNQAVKQVEARTQTAYVNRGLLQTKEGMAAVASYIVIFNKDGRSFEAEDASGNTYLLKENTEGVWERTSQQDEARFASPLSFTFEAAAGRKIKVYPRDDVPMMCVSISVVNPYPDLAAYPERVPVLRESFTILDDVLSQHPPASPDTSSDPHHAPRKLLLELEGKRLNNKLRALMDTGDFSQADAATALETFKTRARIKSELLDRLLAHLQEARR